MPSTPLLNAQGQPIRSALKNEDDGAQISPIGPAKGKTPSRLELPMLPPAHQFQGGRLHLRRAQGTVQMLPQTWMSQSPVVL